jgi:ADP-ribose pyrophosphatase YjhB (NUDIX family)
MSTARKLVQPKPPFELNVCLPAYDTAGERPTVVAIIRGVGSEVLLVMPQKAARDTVNSWMFPQGPIGRNTTPLQALDLLLKSECSLSVADLEPDSAQALAIEFAQTPQGNKRYYFIFARLSSGRHLALSDAAKAVTRGMFFAGNPFWVWNKMAEARAEKQKIIARMLILLVQKQLLTGPEWALEHLRPLHEFVVSK